MKSLRKVAFLVVFLLLSAFSFGAGYFVAQQRFSTPSVQASAEKDLSLFWEAYEILQNKFVDPSKLEDKDKVVVGAIRGLISILEDPYTEFYTPEETKEVKTELRGEFEGVGMEIGIRKGKLTVISPIEGTPAFRAGLRSGDVIVAINGESTEEMTLLEAVSKIRGPKGTSVILTIAREGWKEPREIKIVRDTITIPSVRLKELKPGIYHLRIVMFTDRTGLELLRYIPTLRKSRGIILDLRNNPGGFLNAAIDVAGWFIEKGQPVVIYKGRDTEYTYYSYGLAPLKDKKVVVLVNRGTASAAEILAGALKDNNQAILVGERTFGKGSVQEFRDLRGGYALKYTTARWLTPEGRMIEGKGLEPDVEVKMTEEDIDQDRDPQLDKALEIIEDLLGG